MKASEGLAGSADCRFYARVASSLSDAPQKAFAPPARIGFPFVAAMIAAEQSRWILFAPVLLGAGIALWFLLPLVSQRQLALGLALAVSLAGLALHGLQARLVVSAGLLLALGLAAAEVRSLAVAAPVLHHRLGVAVLTGEVLALQARAGGERWQLLLLRDASDIDPAVKLRLTLADRPSRAVLPGARIGIPAVLQPRTGPVVPGGHDLARAAWFDGISGFGRATGPPVLLAPAPAGRLWLARQRAMLTAFLQEGIGGNAGRVSAALVTGDQGQVPADILEAMRISGLAHLLSVSGFHISVVAAGAFLLFRWSLALWPWFALRLSVRAAAALMAGLAATAYALLAGAEVPAVRAAITAWIVLGALAAGRNPLSLRLIAFAAFAILLLRPEALLSPSFQLSFAAVTALVLLTQSAFGQRYLKRDPEAGVWQRMGRYGLALLASGVVAEIVLSPIAMAHFGRAGVYGAFANLLAIPLTGLAIMPLLAGFLGAALLGLEGVLAPLVRASLDALIGLAALVSAWPGATVTVPAVPLAAFAPGVAGALLLGLLSTRLRWLGGPLLAAALLLAVAGSRPDVFVSPDGRQVGLVQDGAIHFLRPQRGGFAARAWSEAAAVPVGGLLSDLPGSRCSDGGCMLTANGLTLLVLRQAPGVPIGAWCAQADIVVSPAGLRDCRPRWLLLDAVALERAGAVSISTARRTLDSAAARAGDHPWSASALPGEQKTLLGTVRWVPPLTE